MRAADVMARDVATVGPETLVRDLVQLLAEQRVSGVPVVEANGRVVGVVSVQDVLDLYAADGGHGPPADVTSGFYYDTTATGIGIEVPADAVGDRPVRDVMSSHLVTVPADSPLDAVARAMTEANVHRVLVVDGDALVGLISATDVVHLVAVGALAPRAAPRT